MDSNKFFNPSHHAYRSFNSTTTAMLQMYDMWMDSVDNDDLDMSAVKTTWSSACKWCRIRQQGL